MREAFFLDAPGSGQRFCLHHTPETVPRGALLFIHPFAEEMNKSRRMAALAARAFAEAGFAVLQIDLHGCGDSSADFGDATWQGWLDDVSLGRHWLAARHAGAPLYLWGLRAGCLLASQSAALAPGLAGQLWWQPPASGKLLAQQWLRLKIAGEMLAGGGKGSIEPLRQQLKEGLAVEIAGYLCGPALMQGLEAATLAAPAQRLGWFELTRDQGAGLLPVSANTIERWQLPSLHAEAVEGPAFWQSSEIEVAPALIERSLAWMAAA
ncbi:MAG TPA: hydrolase 2, exosortase A system-associated [Burkholderiaceae bacterium]